MFGIWYIKYCIIIICFWFEGVVDSFLVDFEMVFWSVIDFFDNIDDMCSMWELFMRIIIDCYFFFKWKWIRKKMYLWFDSNVLRIMRLCDWVYKKVKWYGLLEDWIEYRKLWNFVISINRKVRKIYFNIKFKENCVRFKVFWNMFWKVFLGKYNISEIKKLVVNGKEFDDR